LGDDWVIPKPTDTAKRARIIQFFAINPSQAGCWIFCRTIGGDYQDKESSICENRPEIFLRPLGGTIANWGFWGYVINTVSDIFCNPAIQVIAMLHNTLYQWLAVNFQREPRIFLYLSWY